MKIVLLGASGYIGSAFRKEMRRRGIEFICPGREEYQTFGGMRLVLGFDCHLVINCAAFVAKPSVDFNEDHKGQTLSANLVLPVAIANACESEGVSLLHVSTGCIYNGTNNSRGFSEADPAQLTFDTSCGVYVGAKQLAEECLKYSNTYICRIRLPFDQHDHQRNFLSKIQRYSKVYSNVNSISHRGDFVKACLDLVELGAPFGTYNMTNQGAISARQIVEMIKQTLCPDREFEFWEEEDFMKNSARTLKSNCVLDISKLLDAGVHMRHVQDAVQESLDNWIAE